MRFTAAFAAAGLTGAAVAQNATASDVYTTEIVTAFTTYCPEATKITIGGTTHTVSEATTLTITSCPGGCTITHPVSYSSTPVAPVSESTTCTTTSSSEVSPMSYSSTMASSTPVAPVYTSSMSSVAPVAPIYPSNGTAPVSMSSGVAPVGTTGTGTVTAATSTGSPIATQTGSGAARGYSAAGAGFLALFGLVAAL